VSKNPSIYPTSTQVQEIAKMVLVDIVAFCCHHFLYQNHLENHPSLPIDMTTPYCPECSAALALQTLSQDEMAPLFEDYSAAMALQAMSSDSDAGSSCRDTKEVSDLTQSVQNLKLNRPRKPNRL